MAAPKTLAISYASFSEGLYLFFSRKTMVSRRTFTFLARSSWVRLNLARYSLILLFIFDTCEIKNQPAYCKDNGHTKNPCPNE